MYRSAHAAAIRPRIRPLRAGDEGPVRDVFAGLSARSRMMRFHAPVPRLSAGLLRRLTSVARGERVALVASVGGRDVGLAEWVRDPDRPGRAEVGIAVVDAHQGRGIGTSLLRALALDARSAGVSELSFVVHHDNVVMLRLLKSWGASVRVVEDGYAGAVPTTAVPLDRGRPLFAAPRPLV